MIIKKRSSSHEFVQHGRVYGKNRALRMPGCDDELFLVGVCWVQADELRVFAHYPEVLVVDSKANTNKFKKAFFLVLELRATGKKKWYFVQKVDTEPNRSFVCMADSLLTRAIPLLVPQAIRDKVEMVMSDADATMGAVITEACRKGGVFPNAFHAFCVYHFERNFFQEFGCNSRRLGNFRFKKVNHQSSQRWKY